MKPDLSREIADLTEESPVERLLEEAPALMKTLGQEIGKSLSTVVIPPAVNVSVPPTENEAPVSWRMEVERNRDGWITGATFTPNAK